MHDRSHQRTVFRQLRIISPLISHRVHIGSLSNSSHSIPEFQSLQIFRRGSQSDHFEVCEVSARLSADCFEEDVVSCLLRQPLDIMVIWVVRFFANGRASVCCHNLMLFFVFC